jgi:hypothetical protein
MSFHVLTRELVDGYVFLAAHKIGLGHHLPKIDELNAEEPENIGYVAPSALTMAVNNWIHTINS